MRPGRKGPGKQAVRGAVGLRLKGFNEAGAQRPRKDALGERAAAGGRGSFNEAGAQRPRKGHVRTRARGNPPPRFNEAGAQRPRKEGIAAAVTVLPVRFNEAGAQRPRKDRGIDGRGRIALALQ